MLIGLNGSKNCGKDTAGKYLVANHGFERLSFADRLKEAFATLFNIPTEWCDMYKNDETVKVAIGFENRPVPKSAKDMPAEANAMWSPMVSMPLRHALQRMGTEVGREYFGKDFWVDQVLPIPRSGSYVSPHNRVVTDVRFSNEAERIKTLGGYVIKIDRPDTDTSDTHRSEMALPGYLVDMTVSNDGDIPKLGTLMEAVLASIKMKEAIA